MIITCPNCNKQFKIDSSLIPNDGRDLQCGSCNYVWFYKIEEENSEILHLKEEILGKEIETKIENKEKKIIKKKQSLEKIKTETNDEKKDKILEKQKKTTVSDDKENKVNKFFAYLIVFIISFVALIILLDTLKNPLINVFPWLEIILFNLFETLQDIKLFIIDLI
tara:strand:+ start:94 stop:591 length:498 start_codon:yes stop_codon:yes gene_type:complete